MKRILLFLFVIFSITAHSQESVWFAKGEKLYNQKKYDEALQAFTKVLELNNKNKEAYYYRGICNLFQGNIYEAISDFTETIALDSNSSDAYNNRGLCYGYTGELEKSVDDFKKAISIDKNFSKAYLNLGSAYLSLEKPDDAIQILNKVVELDSNNAENYFIRGSAYLYLKDYEKGKKDFSRAIEKGLKNNKSYFNRASCFYNLGEYFQAVEDLTKALEFNPKDVEALQNRAICYSKIGFKEKANQDKLKIYMINSGLDEIQSFENIEYKKLKLANSVEFEIPSNWIINRENTEYGEIMICTHDSVSKVSDFYLVGVRMSFDSSMYKQYELKSVNDLLGFWEYNAKENAKEYLQFEEIYRSQIQKEDYIGYFKEVMIQADENSFPIKLFEVILVKEDKLFYSYLQAPTELFDKIKPIFERIYKSIVFIN